MRFKTVPACKVQGFGLTGYGRVAQVQGEVRLGLGAHFSSAAAIAENRKPDITVQV